MPIHCSGATELVACPLGLGGPIRPERGRSVFETLLIGVMHLQELDSESKPLSPAYGRQLHGERCFEPR